MTERFISKGYSAIFVESEEVKQFVIDFFKQDEFEYHYFNPDRIKIINIDDFTNTSKLDNELEYNGKFEGDLNGLIRAAKKKKFRIIIKVGYSSEYGPYDISTYYTFNHDDILAEKVADIIIDNVFIRGIELDVYRRSLIDVNMVNELRKLFNN